jgi:CDP-4-dehydro-6-deoxyglucose reductase
MARLISLSRAARLVGVKRATLQERIQAGDLSTFEGQLDLSELLRAYPDAEVDDNAMIERADAIVEHALNKVVRDRDSIPDAEVLATRVTALSHELASANVQLRRYAALMQQLSGKVSTLAAVQGAGSDIGELNAWIREVCEALKTPAAFNENLFATDMLLRIMAAHVHLQPSGHDYFVQGSDTLLDAGLHAGLALDYGCSDGSCGRCKARLVSGTVKPVRPFAGNLTETDTRDRRILTCANTAVTDITLELVEAAQPGQIPLQNMTGRVSAVERLGDELCVVRLKARDNVRLRFLAGQSARLGVAGLPAAEYPISSCQCDQTSLEFHVFRSADSPFAGHVFEHLRRGDTLSVEGPSGDFVLDGGSMRSAVFIAWEGGFADLKGMIEHAIALDVVGSLHLYWVTTGAGHPYMHNRCRSWSDALDNFHYQTLHVEPLADERAMAHSANTAIARIAEQYSNMNAFDFYIAAPAPVAREWGQSLAARGVARAQLKVKVI